MPTIWIPLLVFIFIVLYIYSTWTFDYWRRRRIPYLKPVPLAGNIFCSLKITTDMVEFGSEVQRSLHELPVIGYYFLRKPSLLIKDPKLIKRVLVTNFDSFQFPSIEVNRNLDPLLAQNITVLGGDVWKTVRSLLMPAFTLSRVKNQFPLMTLECRELIRYLDHEAPKCHPDGIEARDLMRKHTTDVVSRCCLGVLGNSFNDSEDFVQLTEAKIVEFPLWKTIRFSLNDTIPWLWNLLKMSMSNLHGQLYFKQLIKELISYRESNKVFRNDYLQMLMHIKQMGHMKKDRNVIRVQGIDIEFTEEVVAGHAASLFYYGCVAPSYIQSCILYELAANTDIQNRLRDEIDLILCKYSGGFVYEAVKEMHYLDMVLKECLRKYPPFPFITRVCTKPCELPLSDGRTLIVEEGTPTTISLDLIHMNPDLFPDPDTFDPERFSEERKADIKPYSYLPYSVGPRQCLGMQFSEAELKAGIVAIVSHFEIRKTGRTAKKLEMKNVGYTPMAKDGVWLDFIRRM